MRNPDYLLDCNVKVREWQWLIWKCCNTCTLKRMKEAWNTTCLNNLWIMKQKQWWNRLLSCASFDRLVCYSIRQIIRWTNSNPSWYILTRNIKTKCCNDLQYLLFDLFLIVPLFSFWFFIMNQSVQVGRPQYVNTPHTPFSVRYFVTSFVCFF